MTSQQQIAANRVNAQKSTGPRTPAGKQRSSLNARTHGLTAQAVLLSDEDPTAFQALQQALCDQYQPATALEEEWVDQAAGLLWRLRRIPQIEAYVLEEMAHRERVEEAEAVLYVATKRPLDKPAAKRTPAAIRAEAALKKAKRPVPASTAALGFLLDVREGNVLDKLDRHAARLAHQLHRVLADLERTQAQRVPGELVAEDEADPR